MNEDNIIDLSQHKITYIEPQKKAKTSSIPWMTVGAIIVIAVIVYQAIQEARFQECVSYWRTNPFMTEDLARLVCKNGAVYP